MERSQALLIDHDRIDRLYIVVFEVLPFLSLHPTVLAHHQIAGVAAHPLPREQIGGLLNLHVAECPVFQLHQNIHNQQRRPGQQTVLLGQDPDYLYLLSQNAAQEPGQPLRMYIRVKGAFKKRIIRKGQCLLSHAIVHKSLPPVRIQLCILLVQSRHLPQSLDHRLFLFYKC